MKIQNVLQKYKHIPTNSIQWVDNVMLIKGKNCVIRITPNLKREIIFQVENSLSTGFSFYENSSLAEFHQNTMKVPFNANDIVFFKQYNSKQRLSKNTKHQERKIFKNSLEINKKIKEKPEKQKCMRIDISDRFKDFLKNLPTNSSLIGIFTPVYMNICMLCKEPLIIYSHFFQKDFFSNKPKERIVSENEMAELYQQKEKVKRY